MLNLVFVRAAVALLVLGVLNPLPEIRAKPRPTGKPKFTLDPDTLAEVKQMLKVKGQATESTKSAEFGFRLGSVDTGRIIFEEQEQPLQFRSGPASPKCVNPKDRFHVPSGKCYTPGTRGGPCGDNMLFYAQEGNKVYGECDCDYNAEIPLVFHESTGSCYPIYDQAYCKQDEWLVFDDKEHPKCQKRQCPFEGDRTMVLLQNQCVYWDEYSSICAHTYEKVIFTADSLEPSCAEPSVSEQSNFDIPKLKCKPGSRQDIKGNCRAEIKFNFNG